MSDPTRPRRSRKSIAFMPSTSAPGEKNKENPLSAVIEEASKATRRSRWKSLGPGGLEALNAGSGAGSSRAGKDKGIDGGAKRRSSLAPALAPKSILMPTLPISPIKPIPAHRPRSTPSAAAPTMDTSLDFNPQPATVPIRSEEEQQRRAEILAARAARRQSLRNYRVSFAPEATLHTWDVVDYYRADDGSSTPGSSSAADSSRTSTPASASGGGNRNDNPATPTPAITNRPSTPEEQTPQLSSPPSARTEHQKKNRRASLSAFGGATDEVFSSSPLSSTGDVERSPFREGGSSSEDMGSSSDDEADSVGAMTLMGESTMDISNRMDITRPIGGGILPVISRPSPILDDDAESVGGADISNLMDITRPIGGILPVISRPSPILDDDAESVDWMDITRPIGGILPANSGSPGFLADYENMTLAMEITRPIGGIVSNPSLPAACEGSDEDVDFITEPEKATTPKPELSKPVAPTFPPAEKPKTPAKNTRTTPIPGDGFEISAKKRLGEPMTPIKGFGIDKPGLRSPRAAALLSRRKSLGEDSPSFSPIALPWELIKGRKEDEEREKAEEKAEKERQKVEEENMDLKRKIGLLTPRKAGRKSVSLGFSELGGKRERDGELGGVDGGVKRRKSMESKIVGEGSEESPIFTGRVTRSRKSLQSPATLPAPGSVKKQTPRKKAVVIEEPPEPVEPENGVEKDETMEASESGEEKISLQQFLTMTGIDFFDGLLATTKRRQTGFVSKKKTSSGSTVDDDKEASLGDCVVVGACTVPMLDLFQHSCRELKKYIKEGEAVVKEIEQDTLEENPLLFREYMNAPPDIKFIMDTQFRNVKTHARLQAKGVWYDWRMKLLDGVRDGLLLNLKGLKDDEVVLKKQRELLEPVIPGLKETFEQKEKMLTELKEMRRRAEEDDQTELLAARKKLVEVQRRIAEVKAKLAAKREENTKVQAEIDIRERRKEELKKGIEEAERIKTQNRGWTKEEVNEWYNEYLALVKRYGWSIEKIAREEKVMRLLFLKQLLLKWDPYKNTYDAEYAPPVPKKPSDIIPMGDIESSFFSDALRKWLATHAPKLTVQRVIEVVSEYWRTVLAVVDQGVKVNRIFPMKTTIFPPPVKDSDDAMDVDNEEAVTVSDRELRIVPRLLIIELRCRLDITFAVKVTLSDAGLNVSADATAKVVYGGVNQDKINAWLKNVGLDYEERAAWRSLMEELRARCIESKKRAGVGIPVKMG